MADSRELPPLFDVVNIDSVSNDGDNDDDEYEDLFSSAVSQSMHTSKPEKENQVNGSTQDDTNEPQIQPVTESVPLQPDIPDTDPYTGSLLHGAQSLEEVETENYDHFIEIKVTEPQKMGDGMGSYMAYKVTTKTNMPKFSTNQFTVTRRFSDFLGLHDKLVEKYLKLGTIIPPAPEKNVMGTTKVKMSNQGELGVASEFIERRRAALERFLTRTAAHPKLGSDDYFTVFLETDKMLPRATNTSALSSAGVLRLLNKFGETVNKITFKMEENDPWFEEKAQQIDNLDIQLRKLHSRVESLVMNRRDLASLTSSFAKSAAMLSNCEEHTSLSRALSQLAEVEEKVESLHIAQANSDFATLCELLKDYVALIGAIKDVFHERVKVYQYWQHAQLMLAKKTELNSKFALQEHRDKTKQISAEVADWKAKVERGQKEFEKISKVIKKEMERFEISRIKDFKTIIIQYLETMMNQQEELVRYWETFLPEAKAIA